MGAIYPRYIHQKRLIMINVIYLVSRLKQSGPINQAFNIVAGMDKSKCKMIVVTLSPELAQSRMQMYKDASIEVVQLNRKEWDIYGCVRDLKRIIKDRHIDIVHSSGVLPDLCNHFLRKKVATITTLRTEVSNIAEWKGRLISWITQKVYIKTIRTIHTPVACSHFLAGSIEKSTGRKVLVIHNCVNTDFYKPSNNKNEIKKSIGLPPDSRIFISLGSIIRRKNNDILLQYFEQAKKTNDILVVAGRGELLDGYKARYKSPSIIFTGRIDALPYLQAADFLISASLSEGLPNTVLEAIACGVPVILSDIGPHREILETGNVGCIFDANDFKSLENAIAESGRFEYEKLSGLCRQVALEHFSVKATSNSYLQLYKSIIK